MARKAVQRGLRKSLFLCGLVVVALACLPGMADAKGWRVVSPPYVSDDWQVKKVYFPSPGEGWAVGMDSPLKGVGRAGILLHYSNGTWEPLWQQGGINGLTDVHFPSQDEGWAVGEGAFPGGHVILHYSAGTWAPVTLPDVGTRWWLNAVYFPTPTEGWAVGAETVSGLAGDQNVLLHYSGDTWTRVTLPDTGSWCELHDIHFPSPDEGWAVGSAGDYARGVVFHYFDGTWHNFPVPKFKDVNWYLKGVHFITPSEGWAVGVAYAGHYRTGILVHYKDGKWSYITPPVEELSHVYFSSARDGWAVGSREDRGFLLRYRNGTWIPVKPPAASKSSWRLTGIDFTTPGEGWAVGYAEGAYFQGVLLHYLRSIILAPNGDETIPSNSSCEIRWTGLPEAARYKLQYSFNNGSTWKFIPDNIAATSYNWDIPALTKNQTKCRIKVTAYDAQDQQIDSDTSDGPFTIEVIRVVSPNGDELWTSGETRPVEWTATTRNTIDKIDVLYTTNGGMSWKAAGEVAGGETSLNWVIPDVLKLKSKCKVKVVLIDAKGKTVGSDMSDDTFAIQP